MSPEVLEYLEGPASPDMFRVMQDLCSFSAHYHGALCSSLETHILQQPLGVPSQLLCTVNVLALVNADSVVGNFQPFSFQPVDLDPLGKPFKGHQRRANML